ncbi:hypothetical protein GCM10018952_18020 [Streptosporangium vulgare]
MDDTGSGGRPLTGRTPGGRSFEEQNFEERASEERAADERTSGERTSGERTANERRSEGRASDERTFDERIGDFYSPAVSLNRLRPRPDVTGVPADLLLRALEPPAVKVRHIPLVDLLRKPYRELGGD